MDGASAESLIWETLPGWCGPVSSSPTKTPDQFGPDGTHHDVLLLRNAASEVLRPTFGNVRVMVEIGCFAGRSAFVLHEARPDLLLHCYDPYPEGIGLVEDGAFGLRLREAMERFQSAIANCCGPCPSAEHPGIQLHVLDSVQGGMIYDGPLVGLLHIDGLHTYEQVKAELTAWYWHLAPESSVIFDDWLSYDGAIQRAAWEVFDRDPLVWVCRDEGIGSRGRGYGRFRLERR